eukprot:gene15041-16594_t
MAVEKPKVPNYARFIMGGAAGMMATCFVQPLDLVKTRMQMSGIAGEAKAHKSSFHAIFNIVRSEGVLGVYNGLSAALLRQASYTTTRLGVYTSLMEHFKGPDGAPPTFFKKLGMAMTAGAIGSFIGTPAELALIRMTSDGRLPPAEQRRYKNVADALIRVVREEGVATLWRGCLPTVARAVVVNAAQLVTYSQAKQELLLTGYFHDNIWCHFSASMISGFATTFASMPPDIAKTRIQSMKIIDGKPEYKGALDVLIKIVRKEGIVSLWKGFTPCYLRIGPHTVLTFIFLEQLNIAAKKFYGVPLD